MDCTFLTIEGWWCSGDAADIIFTKNLQTCPLSEDWLLPFIFNPSGKAQFELDCAEFDGEKSVGMLLNLCFQKLVAKHEDYLGVGVFEDVIGLQDAWSAYRAVLSMVDRAESARLVAEATLEDKMSRIFSGCYNLGPYEVTIPVLLKLTTNKHLKKPPIGNFHGYNSR